MSAAPSEAAREAWALVAEIYKDPEAPKVALCATGGAAHATSWLLATPGASSCVMDIQYPYHRGALVEYVRGDTDPDESFASKEMARRLARHARRRALGILAKSDSQQTAASSRILGVGYSGALATSRERRGEDKMFLALLAADGHEVLHTIKFPRGQSSRPEQDELASLAAIRAIAKWAKGEVAPTGLPEDLVLEDTVEELAPRRSAESVQGVLRTLLEGPSNAEVGSNASLSSAWFWPIGPRAQRAVDMHTTALTEASIRHLVVSGSFNPLHKGHEALAMAARDLKRRLEPNAQHVLQIIFELSVRNADKGEIDVASVRSRVEQFAEPASAAHGPWPVVVTQASIFVDKAALFPASTFVIGYDTAIRIVDPKYYADSYEQMCEALLTIAQQRCDFIVAGRLGSDGAFLTLNDMRDSIPSGFHSLFHGLAESDFRLDISSTEIRQQRSRQ